MVFIEVVQSLDDTGELIASRFPADGEADLKVGAQVIVRESQSAVFFRGGKALDTFGPGRHTLTTANIPLLGALVNAPFGGNTPFKAEVYYVNHKIFPNIKWGTKEAISFRDTELSMVRLRAFGILSFKVEEAQLFINKLVGTQRTFSASQITDFIKGIAVARLTDFLGENLKSVFDLPRYYDEIGAGTKARIKDDFAKYGLYLEDFLINAITPPEEVQKKIDERSSMAALGNLDNYMKYKTAQAIQDAANQPGGGMAAAGMGAGMGMGLGMMMPNMMNQAFQPGQAQPAQAPAAAASGPTLACPKCQVPNQASAKFCANCGEKFQPACACPKCQQPLSPGSKFCSGCGTPAQQAAPGNCAQCGQPMPPGTKFCASCGNKG